MGPSSATMPKVLVVDDDPGVRLLVGRRLQQAGYRVRDAAGADEALEWIEAKGAPDVVVLDVSMPQVDGLELLSAIRDQVGEPDLPAVFLSGRIESDDIAAGRALGAVYLTKPFVASALLNAIERVLAARAAPPAADW